MVYKVHTTVKLALALENVGLMEMAKKAREGFYHDFLSPLDFPEMRLEADLRTASSFCPEAEALRQRHLKGEFDASKEESDAWAASPDGKAAYAELTKRGH